MKIKKILNNNAVVSVNEKNQDVVVTGSGIAFQKKIGDIIPKNKIEKVFVVENNESSTRIQKLVDTIPIEYINITEDIYTFSSNFLSTKLNESVVFTLADHINFAIERMKSDINISNPLSWEVKRYYAEEFKAGQHSLDIIENKLGVRLPEDEAASIALHLVNARVDKSITEVVQIIKILQDSLNIVKYHFRIDFDDELLSYQRMVTHLKFFAQRIVIGENLVEDGEELFKMIKEQYPESFKCACKIKDYAKDSYGFNVSNSELTFLTVHIERVTTNTKNKLNDNKN